MKPSLFTILCVMALSDVGFTAWGLGQGGVELNPLANALWNAGGVAALLIAKAVALVLVAIGAVYLKRDWPLWVGIGFHVPALLVPMISLVL